MDLQQADTPVSRTMQSGTKSCILIAVALLSTGSSQQGHLAHYPVHLPLTETSVPAEGSVPTQMSSTMNLEGSPAPPLSPSIAAPSPDRAGLGGTHRQPLLLETR